MTKKLSKIILAMTLFLSLIFGHGNTVQAASQTILTGQEAIVTIKTRLKDYFLELDTIDDGAKVETCYVSNAEDYLKLMAEDGSWSDVNYADKTNASNGKPWSPYLALDRLQAIAIAYNKPGNSLYNNDKVIDKLNKALLHWKKANPSSDGWWQNDVGVQLRFSRIGLFMEGLLAEDSFKVITDKLITMSKPIVKYGTGQNNLWFDQNHVYHALLTKNEARLNEMVDDYLNYCLSTQLDDQTAEAVQVDNSFYMHGKQFYSNGYGMSMFRDMSFWIYMLRGTEFAIGQDVVERMADYMLDGTSWTIRGDIMELYLGYRPYKFDVGYKNYAEEYVEPLKRMIVSDSVNASRYQAVLNNIEGKTVSNGKNGNYYMWRSGYASHMRDGYGVNIKMDSKDIIGGEWRGSTNKYGQLIYWTSSATSTITIDGNEYTSIYPVYDWTHCPGATTANRIVGDFSEWGRFTNGTNHTIGVSNGKYGNTAYVMDKKDTQATKGYFFFDDEFVALGAGINSKENTAIHTTLNQSKAVDVKVDGTTVSKGTVGKEYVAKSIYNNKIGYVFLDDTKVKISYDDQKDAPSLWADEQKQTADSVFTAYLDHGVKPKDATYAYVVIPNQTATEVKNYANNVPVTVVANNENVQAVRHDGLKQTQINFYKAGSLEYKDGHTVKVDYPCNLIIDESGNTTEITMAVTDQDAGQNVTVELTYDGQTTRTEFCTKGLPYAGQSLTAIEGESFQYQASSYTNGHAPAYARDGKEDTYWESQTNGTEWMSTYVDSLSKVKEMTISWGNEYAKHYKIYASTDGHNYTEIKDVTNGDGGKDVIPLNDVYQYIKIEGLDSNGNHYQIKEIEFEKYENLSRKKSVTVSSVSTYDDAAKKMIGPLTVDGNYSSRWASQRASDDEWIIINLEKYAKLDSINILWEGACSEQYEIQVSQDGKRWITVKDNLQTSSNLKDIVELQNVYGRYVKIHSHKSKNKKYGISIFEIDVYGEYVTEPPLEISYLQKAFASSFDSVNIADYVTDGDASTYWQSISADNQWIYIELKDTYQIYDVNIQWSDNYATSYDIEVSNDVKNWQTVKNVRDGNGGEDNHLNFRDVRGRYLRIKLNQSSGNMYQIKEIVMHGDLIETNESINIALKKTYQASSELNQNTADKAFDGLFKNDDGSQSRWSSNTNSDNEYIQVDLGDFYDVNGVKLYWEGQGAAKYKILVSRDGKQWSEVYTDNDGQPGILDLSLDKSIVARYIKMQGIKCASAQGYSLWEFEVYGQEYNGENGLVNVASYQPAASSTIYKQNIPSKAVDSDKNSSFKSIEEKNPWLNVFLKDTYTVSAAKISFVKSNIEELALESSLDGETWKTVKTISTVDSLIPLYFTFDEIDTRYLRIRVLDESERILEVKDFAVYGKLSDKFLDENIAAFKTSVASSEYYGGGFTFESQYAFDKSIENRGDSFQSRWVSNRESADEWIYVDLGDYYKVSRVILNWEAHATEYKVQVSDDAQTWTDISHIKDGVAGVKELIYKETPQAKYVRMQGINYATKYGYSLWEFEVYGLSIRSELKQVYDTNCHIDMTPYTPASIAVYQSALENAIKHYQNDEATGNEMTAAIKQLKEAVVGLIKKADKSELSLEIAIAKRTNLEFYTEKSVKVFKEALKNAEEIYGNANATQNQVNDAVKQLKTANDGLVKKDEIIITVPDNKNQITVTSGDRKVSVSGYLHKGIELFSSILKEEQVKELENKIKKVNPKFFETNKIEKVYDIYLLLNGYKYSLDESVEVKLTLEKELLNKRLGIIYIDDQGNIAKIASIRNGNTITFKTTHFSKFAIVSYNSSDVNEFVQENKPVSPKTSDTSSIGVNTGLMLTAVIIVYIVLKKRKENT